MLVTLHENPTWYVSNPSVAKLCCDFHTQLTIALTAWPGECSTAVHLLVADMAADCQRTPIGMPWLIQSGWGLSSKLFSPGQALVGLLITHSLSGRLHATLLP